MKYIIITLLLLQSLYAKHLHKEKYYQTIFCNKMNGIIEYRLPDKSRIDCLTSTYAIEVDWANKWHEGIGQSLYYGLMSDKKPGVVLIIENPQKEQKYIRKISKVSKSQKIQVWTIDKNLVIKRLRKE